MKNPNQYYLLLTSLVLLSSVFSYGADGRFESKRFGSYKVSVSQDFESGLGKIIIEKGKEKVFEESEIDNHYYFGNHFDENPDRPNLYSGHDITGKGIPNLIISNWTGGAHCCHFLHIFELGRKFRKLITVEANSSSIRLVDLDHDGFPEVEFWDGAIDYQFASFAGSPGGRVILKFKKDHYEVATKLMKKSAPTTAKINNMKKRIVLNFKKNQTSELPHEFLKTMMDLSYSGHFQFALKLAGEVWPNERPGLEKFKSEFSQALRESLYWQEL